MNANMLELYKQAQVPCTAIDPSNNMPYETTCFSADKFAELIVKECADCAYHMEKDSGPITADLIKIRIMSLIGVE
jgi:hypothetical protein